MPPHGYVSVSLNCTVDDRLAVADIGARLGHESTSDTVRAALNLLAKQAGIEYTFVAHQRSLMRFSSLRLHPIPAIRDHS